MVTPLPQPQHTLLQGNPRQSVNCCLEWLHAIGQWLTHEKLGLIWDGPLRPQDCGEQAFQQIL